MGEMVRHEVEQIGGSVEDDGEPELSLAEQGEAEQFDEAMLDSHANIDVDPSERLSGVCDQTPPAASQKTPTLQAHPRDPRQSHARLHHHPDGVDGQWGDTHWGEDASQPSYMEILGRLYPEAKFIHVIRDGRAVSA